MKIAYISYSGKPKYAAANGFNEVLDLLPLLQAKGLDMERCVWNDPSVDWARYAVALLRTPWDYHENVDAFRAWLTHLQGLGIRLLNDYAVVRWNLDKHYLLQIEAQGYDVIRRAFWPPIPPLIFPPCLRRWPPTNSFSNPASAVARRIRWPLPASTMPTCRQR
jgi:hypothetical protein